ncbi:16S rRNA (guanine(527)-N(7))-methyltransferase RsmG [Sulfurospirillum arcachonense]|uniref:16S rRNA (guanine(527)-N(7))-methyltransferase RsmG n=1 Tax=Sulfurospirillum arcachonense TaxID=57666 RepID=UPI0004B9DAC4|nr:16S rRNA (guanine(527)-N(7))-methyltransferase RsmG [Sulfurospirillum arcachonense]
MNIASLPKDFSENCEIFCELILKYNKTHNITGAKDKHAVYENINDSIYPIEFLPMQNIKTAIDIGTGAGFPGLILAMALPNIQFTLFEPIAKKSSFLHLIKTTLKLKNVIVSTKRVEKAQAFEADLICSRAVTNTNMLINLCKKYITPSSLLLFYKGERVDEEVMDLTNFEIFKKDKRNYLLIKDVNVI